MKSILIHLIILTVTIAPLAAQNKELVSKDSSNSRLSKDSGSGTSHIHLPPPHQLDLTKPISCTAIAGANLTPSPDTSSYLETKITLAREHFTIQIKPDRLLVFSQSEDQQVNGQTYEIINNTPVWMTAGARESSPAAHTILINKESGFALLAVTEPSGSYPSGRTVYLRCVEHHIHVHPKH